MYFLGSYFPLTIYVGLLLTSKNSTSQWYKKEKSSAKTYLNPSCAVQDRLEDVRMAADGGLRRLFEKPLPENPTLLEALSAWNRVGHPKRAVDPASFTDIFGELHFQEKLPDHVATALVRAAILPPTPPPSLPPPPPPRAATALTWLDIAEKSKDDSSLDALLKPPKPAPAVKRSASFCMKKSPSTSSLLLCTEGLCSESTVDVVRDDDDEDGLAAAFRHKEETYVADAGAATEAGKDEEQQQQQPPPPPPSFPPPIRSISGRGGKPCVCFRSFRADGRFVLMQVVIPGKELLNASREGGRLRLQFASAAAHVRSSTTRSVTAVRCNTNYASS